MGEWHILMELQIVCYCGLWSSTSKELELGLPEEAGTEHSGPLHTTLVA